jgi:hypothetical protein
VSTTSITLADAEQHFGVQVDGHHDRQADIPVLTGLQFQGDVAVIPTTDQTALAIPAASVPQAGVAVVRGENGGNTHLLLASGPCYWAPSATSGVDPSDLDLGTLTVPDGSTAYLAHPEHAFAGIGSGTYTLRRQREQADVARFVED